MILEDFFQNRRMALIELLRAQSVDKVTYDEPYKETWSEEELLSHIQSLKIRNQPLFNLPPLPRCIEIICVECQLNSIESLPLCEFLVCIGNQLNELPPLPQCEVLWC